MSSSIKRAALLVVTVAALGACEYGLGAPEEPVAPGSSVTLTNAGGSACPIPEPEVEAAAVDPDPVNGVPLDLYLITEIPDESPVPFRETFTDDEGRFDEPVTAPTIPGPHLLLADCAEDDSEPGDVPGFYAQVLNVAHTPLSISLSDDAVAAGETVTATFNRCQNDNDLSLAEQSIEEGVEPEAEQPTWEELATDYPDLVVTLDGVPVATIAGTERYPTGTVDVPVKLDEPGDHEIKGVCTYQTFSGLEEYVQLVIENLQGAPVGPEGLAAAAIEYPVELEELPFTYDEATTTAAAPVSVAAPAVENTGTAAQPVPAAPAYTG